ncbi:hypothetical protein [Hufsiella ginkgonis]|uniref:Uncharacterized protein n=1 Tax=Hufsiella ginkgonis TaxID=2695274 RepID=A0A7K1Y3R6_9SPHI|nr:hypothetical protein [Hufsiella ginkgonis]MXV17758.1 hypothetical protein [Hufsiella ginkgonis]
MKRTYLLALGLFATQAAFSQQGTIAGNFTNTILQARQNEMINTKLTDFSTIATGRFYSDAWLSGSATGMDGKQVSSGYKFNFDKLSHELCMKWKDQAIVINSASLKTFTLIDPKTGDSHVFARQPAVDEIHFFEVLSSAATDPAEKYSLLKLVTAEADKQISNNYAANSSGDHSQKFTEKTEYFLVKKGKADKVKLNKKALLSSLSGEDLKLAEAFLAESKTMNEVLARNLVRVLNKETTI